MKENPLDLEKLMRVPYVDPDLGFDIHPDGQQIAFSWNITGNWEIFVTSLNGSVIPEQISNGEGAKFAPRWSPDGRMLAFALDLDGGENYDIHVYDIKTGQHTNITPNTPDAFTTDYDWSPDGTQIALCCDIAGKFDTYIIPSTGGNLKLVLDKPYHDMTPVWSPAGDHLAVVCEAAGQDYWTYILNLKENLNFPISIEGKPISAKDPCWSEDGTQLLFSSDISGEHQIGLFDLESQEINWLADNEGEKEHPDWSPDGRAITYVTGFGPDYFLAVHHLQNKDLNLAQIEPGVIYTPTFTPDGEYIILVFDNPRHPDDLWKYSVGTGEFWQITNSLPEDIDIGKMTIPKQITYPGLDGVDVPALLYQASGQDEPAPAVINVHGGPNWLSQITWDPFTQHLAGKGWVVLAPNYRGSTGYGKEWQYASRFDLGGVDTRDVVAGANYLENRKIARPDKIAITGRSWGGYLTMTCLTQYPERWVCGSASVPFLNWFTSHENSREDLQYWDLENFGDPVTNYDLWYAHSPFFFLDQIIAPVQFLCGENDVRCPASESMQAADELIKLGKEVDYVIFKGEGHALLKVETQVEAKTKRAAFIKKILER